MDDQLNVKIANPHISRWSSAMLMISILTVNTAYSGTGGENNDKANPKTEKKVEDAPENGKVIPKLLEDITDASNSAQVMPVYETFLPNQEPSASGEDQNAVLSFNVIQYIFQRFKFSEEGY